MQVSENTVVQIHYTLKNETGEILDTSEGREPLVYLHGSGNILPKLEAALEGRIAGDTVDVTLQPADGYGERIPELVQSVPREQFPVENVEPGMRFSTDTEEGSRLLVVTEVENDSVTIDANHPLAGETLNFNVGIVEVRAATESELEHGHVHGGDGHDHD